MLCKKKKEKMELNYERERERKENYDVENRQRMKEKKSAEKLIVYKYNDNKLQRWARVISEMHII